MNTKSSRQKKRITRRDLCYLVGRRAQRLGEGEAAIAWKVLAQGLEDLGERDVPKFADVLGLIRGAHLATRKVNHEWTAMNTKA